MSCLVCPQQCQWRAHSTCSRLMCFHSDCRQPANTDVHPLTHPLHCRLLWPLIQRVEPSAAPLNHAGAAATLGDMQGHGCLAEVTESYKYKNNRLDPAWCHSLQEQHSAGAVSQRTPLVSIPTQLTRSLGAASASSPPEPSPSRGRAGDDDLF